MFGVVFAAVDVVGGIIACTDSVLPNTIARAAALAANPARTRWLATEDVVRGLAVVVVLALPPLPDTALLACFTADLEVEAPDVLASCNPTSTRS